MDFFIRKIKECSSRRNKPDKQVSLDWYITECVIYNKYTGMLISP